MRGLTRFLVRPTRLPWWLLATIVGLLAVLLVTSVTKPHAADPSSFRPISAVILVILLLLALLSAPRMYREYSTQMREASAARRTAVDNAKGRFRKWRASERNSPLPLTALVFFWVFAGVLASAVGFVVTG